MKNLITVFFTLLSVTVFAQFNAPTNLIIEANYYSPDEWGDCGGEYHEGAFTCFSLDWDAPDFSSTDATFEYYKIYNQASANGGDAVVVASLTDIYYSSEELSEGQIWVTALYSDPAGESLPTNKVTSPGIATVVKEYLEVEPVILYNRTTQNISFNNYEKISKINMYDISGRIIKTSNNIKSDISIQNLSSGLYIVEIYTDNGSIERKKIIK